MINRVVGPGTPSEFASNGFLTDASWNSYVQNGVLSAKASLILFKVDTMRMEASIPTGTAVGVYVNDNFVGTYPTPINACIELSTKYLKFAQRVLNRSTPTPAENRIAFTLDFQSFTNYNNYFNENNTTANFGNISFQAMAPVIMVHGWNSGPWWWGPSQAKDPTPADLDGCGPDLWTPNDQNNGRLDFIQPFIQAKIPFSCQVTIDPSSSNVDDGAVKLEARIRQKAAEFGAKHVHLIGHSKGGLWVRAVLPLLQSDNLGVYSVTSIDTPHHGSSLADLLVIAHQQAYLGLFNLTWLDFVSQS